MNAPGITVRPLKQIWGTSEFNEVFFDDVKVSIDCRIGDEGAGWPLATSVLSSERSAADVGFVASFRRVFDELDTLVTRERNLPANAELQLETIYTAYEACRLHIYSTLSRRAGGQPSGAETSVDKLLMNRVIQMLGALELDLDFVPGLIGQRDETTYRYLYGRAASIYGGTEQVQRNIIAQRVLEMPRGR
jgi:alkylation response protein AidB-like acyl-CoA dehydrogenase